jgi:hypothetical protein
MAENENKSVLKSAWLGFGTAAGVVRGAVALVAILWLNPMLLAYFMAFIAAGVVVRWLWRLRA